MIPHHSIAILTSERAELSDPRVRELADGIIQTQCRHMPTVSLRLTACAVENPTTASWVTDQSGPVYTPGRYPQGAARHSAVGPPRRLP